MSDVESVYEKREFSIVGTTLPSVSSGRAGVTAEQEGGVASKHKSSTAPRASDFTAEQIKAKLVKLDMSVEQLARTLGESGATVRGWLSGRRGSRIPRQIDILFELIEAKPEVAHREARETQANGRDKRIAMMLKAAKSRKFPTGESLAEHLGVNPVTIYRLRDEAVRRGLVTEADWNEYLYSAKEERKAPKRNA